MNHQNYNILLPYAELPRTLQLVLRYVVIRYQTEIGVQSRKVVVLCDLSLSPKVNLSSPLGKTKLRKSLNVAGPQQLRRIARICSDSIGGEIES